MRTSRTRCHSVMGCMVDPKANEMYVESKAVRFAVGSTVWVLGIQFTVVSVANGQLTLEPINVKT
jgi:hypothetical protein